MRTPTSWYERSCALPPWLIVTCSVAAYLVCLLLLPALLLPYPMFQPLSRLSVASAPLVAILAALPLPQAMWRKFREKRLVGKLASVETMRSMRWDELEVVVRRVFEMRGYAAERVGGAGADGGVDVVLRRRGRTMLVQCKQWTARQVSVNVVRELAGVVAVHGADGGVVVTCGVFTRDARAFAARSGIVLVDGLQLLRMRDESGIVLPSLPRRDANLPCENAVSCPNCGARMIRRSGKSGSQTNQDFLGCSNYPICRGTRPL